jgi:hypothetical protein
MSIQGLKDITGNARILRISNNNEGTGIVDLNKIRNEQKAKLFGSNEPDTRPDDLPNENNVIDAQERLYEAVEQSKIKNPQELLMQPAKAPVKDQKGIDANKNLAKTSALIQLLDGIAGAVNLQRKQEEAVVAPQNLVPGAFEAVNNIRNINQKFDLDLRNYNRRQEEIDATNKTILKQANAHNANVDVKLAEMKMNDAIRQSNKALSEERAKALAQDKTAERLYEVGLRFISNENPEVGIEYLKMAGFDNKEIQELLRVTKKVGPANNKGGDNIKLKDNYYILASRLGALTKQDEEDIKRAVIRNSELLAKREKLPFGITDTYIDDQLTELREKFGELLYDPRFTQASYITIAKTLHDYEGYSKGKMPELSNDEISINKYLKFMVDKIDKENNQEMAKAIATRMEMDLRRLGLNDKQIEQKISAILNSEKLLTDEELMRNDDMRDLSQKNVRKHIDGLTPEQKQKIEQIGKTVSETAKSLNDQRTKKAEEAILKAN